MQRHERDAAPIYTVALDQARSDAERRPTAIHANSKQLSAVLTRTAEALEKSAGLAEEHARRRARSGAASDAARERRAAERAHQAAERARSFAARYEESPR
ncbi:MAG: hypothetical protein ACTHQQ_00315 [Solirubrobacteraceae bacterium]